MQREMMRAREGDSLHIDRLVKTYFQPIYRRVGELLHKGIAEGEFRKVDCGALYFFHGGDDRFLFQQRAGDAAGRALQSPHAAAHRRKTRRSYGFYFRRAVSALFQRRAFFSQIRSTPMSARNKFFILLGIIFVIAATYYFFSTDHSKDLVLIGTVDSNQVIVSAQVEGRIQKCWWMKARG